MYNFYEWHSCETVLGYSAIGLNHYGKLKRKVRTSAFFLQLYSSLFVSILKKPNPLIVNKMHHQEFEEPTISGGDSWEETDCCEIAHVFENVTL